MIRRFGLSRRDLPKTASPATGIAGLANVAGQANAAIQEREALALLRDYENSGRGWFWATDSGGNLTYISECVANVLDLPVHDLIGKPFTALLVLDQEPEADVARSLPMVFGTRKTFSDFAVRANSSSVEIWWAISGRPQLDSRGNFLGYRGNGSDVTKALLEKRDASRLAMYDSLTGLSNRHRMGQRLGSTINAYRTQQRTCALMMIDLDRFKQVNDTLGHPAGDELLKQVSERLISVFDKGTEIGRLGGDEFQVILPDFDDRGKLGDLAKRVINILSQPFWINGARCVIGASIGIAISPFDGVTSDDLVLNADLALYSAKGGGRGQFRFFSKELQAGIEQRRRLEADLRGALALGQICLYYQPTVNLANNTVCGLEALMRWDHPDYGELSPSLFIPIAEESNLILSLGEWALRQACKDAVSWPASISVSVNIAPVQFSSQEFVETVRAALAESGLPASRLELEVTEGILAKNDTLAQETLNSLKQLGVKLALDNFGSGYSPLAYLRHSPFDKIKIDRSIVLEINAANSRSTAIAAAIVAMTKQLDMISTAQGIEARDELDRMRELGVDQIQGHIYASPCTLEDVMQSLASGQWVIEPEGPVRSRAERRTVLRKVGIIHEDYRYDVTMRNLSRGGASIEGLVEVPVGTQFVLDLGEGQLVVCTVRRSAGIAQGLEFETSLVDDGAGGLVTRHRVSRQVLEAMGMPSGPGSAPVVALNNIGGLNLPKFGTAEQAKASRAA